VNPRSLVFLGLAALAAPQPSLAASLSDYLANGFEIGRSTFVSGTFHGCIRLEELKFADGSEFLCSRTTSPRHAVNARVYMLRDPGGSLWVVLIDGQTFDGTITRIAGRLEKLNVTIDGPDVPSLASADAGKILPVTPILSITELQDEQTTKLNDAQSQPVLQNPANKSGDADQLAGGPEATIGTANGS
jgi:hypothetical protein